MKIISKKIFSIGLLFSYPFLTFAQPLGPNTERFIEILKRINSWFLALLVTVSAAFFVYAGFLYLTAAGDTEKIKTASKTIIYAVVAIGVAMLAYVFLAVVQALVRK